MSDNKEVTLADIKQGQDAIYAALVAILAHLQDATSFDDYARKGTAREDIRVAHNHIRDECEPRFL